VVCICLLADADDVIKRPPTPGAFRRAVKQVCPLCPDTRHKVRDAIDRSGPALHAPVAMHHLRGATCDER